MWTKFTKVARTLAVHPSIFAIFHAVQPPFEYKAFQLDVHAERYLVTQSNCDSAPELGQVSVTNRTLRFNIPGLLLHCLLFYQHERFQSV